MRKIVQMKGPLQASISASGATAQNSKGIDTTSEACAEPVVSTVQGGFVTRSVNFTTANVPLRPKIKVVNRGSKPIRRGRALGQPAAHDVGDVRARCSLAYPRRGLEIVPARRGARRQPANSKMLLQASRANQTGPLIVVGW